MSKLPTVWAFNGADENARKPVYESVKNGKSRFGWSWEDHHNLKVVDKWNGADFDKLSEKGVDVSDQFYRQFFLFNIEKGDWIVHINTPEWGKCIAAKVTSEYDFDEGLKIGEGVDFRHNFSIDTSSIVEFDRNDPNILPTVNLQPRQRQHMVNSAEDFLRSMENLKEGRVRLGENETREEFHLKESVAPHLQKITELIHKMHKGKKLEIFLAKVMQKIPGVVDVKKNGFGWGSDYGADLIVFLGANLGKIDYEHKVIVQVKSFSGQHSELNAIEQIKTGIEKYGGTAGLLITTGERTEELEKKATEVSDKIGKQIDLLCGEEVAQFVIANAPDLLFGA
ncbi:MAG: restriction endonuclease [Alphaproteobacteria bacterium]|nr:restriction endonuclease [Alphaproteobacteria bacterium]MDA8031373.1 restriction endonuclease [Alphaproteobacteria bacterium]